MATQNNEAAMGTNSYSMDSKRSVERLYFPNDLPFFDQFCCGSKFKRRAPLINRGYWLRMKAIETVTETFVKENSMSPDSPRVKVIVNLGCGYDPLPWRLKMNLARDTTSVNPGTFLFIDADYEELVKRKASMLDNPLFGDEKLEEIDCGGCHYNAYNGWYAQIGVDLKDLDRLAEGLDLVITRHASVTKLYNFDFLFVAEVSITYMPTVSADQLLKWVAVDFRKSFSGKVSLEAYIL
jgi:tRNA wybutosine-synthesizing protein 4